MAGFEPVYAADFDTYACQTYAANVGAHVNRLDFTELSPTEFAEQVLASSGRVDVVAGGPPCQGWSIQRRGPRDDIRNDLALWFAQTAVEIGPRVILMENVPTIFGKRGAAHLHEIERVLTDSGYGIHKKILDASQFGVPQVRRRALLVAARPAGATFCFPKATRSAMNPVTVREAIGDLPPPPLDGSEHPHFHNHRIVKVSDKNLERLTHVPEGGGRLDVPAHLQLPCHAKSNGHRHLDVYGRLWWDRPSGTITAMFDNFTRGRFAHPVQNRNITSREGARLQSFPDWFHFIGPKKDVARQIGNAVPPLMASEIAASVLQFLFQDGLISEERVERLAPELAETLA